MCCGEAQATENQTKNEWLRTGAKFNEFERFVAGVRVVREEGAEMGLMQSVASAYLCMPAPRPNRLTQFSTRSHHDQTDLVQIYSAAAATSPWRTLACVHA